MTGHCCNNVHLSMDDTFIQWDEILGDPSKSTALNEFVDSKIKGIGDDLGKLLDDKINAATDELREELTKEVEAIALDIDPYKIKYKETTVGDALDELNAEEFTCTMGKYGPFEIGQKFPTFTVGWSCAENPKEQTITRLRDCAPVERYKLDPSVREYTFANVSSTETFVIEGVDGRGKPFTASTKVEFKHRWYRGTYGFTDPTNKIITNFSSEFVDKDTDFGTKIFDCENGSYIYFAVPDDLHLTYDFFSNGLKDTNWTFAVKNVTNQYGYVHPYRIYRTENLLHGYNIYIEVESHDWY